MGGHLGQAQHSILAGQAVVMGLLAAVLAIRCPAMLTRREFFEARRLYGIQLLMLPPVGDDFVRVRADEVALEAVEVRSFVLRRACGGKAEVVSRFRPFRTLKISFLSIVRQDVKSLCGTWLPAF